MKSSWCALLGLLTFVFFSQVVLAGPAGSFQLTVELRDGSRVIGTSKDDRLAFDSATLGELKLPLEKIRSVEATGKTNQVRLTTALGDTLVVAFLSEDIRVKTTYGVVSLPVGLVKNLRVTTIGGVGRPRDGLIALWSAEGDAVDSVGGNNGFLRNVSFTEGVAGRAFLFAPDNYPYNTRCGVEIPDRPVFALTKSMTIECWIRPRGNGYMIFFRGDHRPGVDPYQLSLDGQQNLSFGVCSGDNNHIASVKTPVDLGAWIHVAAVLDDNTGTLSLYTNGVLAAQTTTDIRPFGTLQPDQSPGVGIGNVNDGGNNFPFIGEIDEVGLYDRALSESEINAIYQANAANAGARAKPLPPRSNRMMFRNGVYPTPTLSD